MEKWIKRIIFWTVLFIILILGLRYLFIYFSPFIIAAILASLINPLEERLELSFRLNRGIAVLLILVLMITLFLFLLILGISQVYLELNNLLRNLPDYDTLGEHFHWLILQNNRLQDLINSLDVSLAVRQALNENLQLLYNALKNGLVLVINHALSLLGKLPLLLLIMFLSFIATFFISRDRDLINQYIIGLFPRRWKSKVFKIEKELASSALSFIRAELILIAISGGISWAGLLIIGNPYAVIVGILTAILDLIPIIGPGLLFIPWIIYNLILGNLANGMALLLLYTIMAAVREGVEAKVMGSTLGFHPLLMMIALYVGFRTMGSIGFLIGPTVLVFCRAIIKAGIIEENFFKE